jgi:hypothetical protein
MELNKDKCVVIKPGILQDHTADAVRVCGTYLGSDTSVCKAIKGRTRPWMRRVAKLRGGLSAQCSMLLLRFCVEHNAGFLMRTTPPRVAAQALEEFAEAVFGHVKERAGIDASEWAALQEVGDDGIVRAVCGLPMSKGGLGLGFQREKAAFAYAASLMLADAIIFSRFGDVEALGQRVSAVSGGREFIKTGKILTSLDLDDDQPLEIKDAKQAQRRITEPVYDMWWQQVFSQLGQSPDAAMRARRVRFVERQDPLSRAWMRLAPTAPCQRIPDNLVEVGLRAALLLPLARPGRIVPGVCKNCTKCVDEGRIDHHVLTCNKMAGMWNKRHNAIAVFVLAAWKRMKAIGSTGMAQCEPAKNSGLLSDQEYARLEQRMGSGLDDEVKCRSDVMVARPAKPNFHIDVTVVTVDGTRRGVATLMSGPAEERQAGKLADRTVDALTDVCAAVDLLVDDKCGASAWDLEQAASEADTRLASVAEYDVLGELAVAAADLYAQSRQRKTGQAVAGGSAASDQEGNDGLGHRRVTGAAKVAQGIALARQMLRDRVIASGGLHQRYRRKQKKMTRFVRVSDQAPMVFSAFGLEHRGSRHGLPFPTAGTVEFKTTMVPTSAPGARARSAFRKLTSLALLRCQARGVEMARSRLHDFVPETHGQEVEMERAPVWDEN